MEAPIHDSTHRFMPTSLRNVALALACLPFVLACSSDGPAGDREAPTVATTSPANGATGVARATTVTATFSEPIDPTSATTSTFIVSQAGGLAVPGTVAVSGATVTFTPSSLLAYGTAYTARVTTGIEDIAGNPLAAQSTWTFTTVVNAPPSVQTVSPIHGATGVARNATISATFSEPVAAASATTANFTVTPVGGTPIGGTVTVNGNVVTFTPTTLLAGSTVYSARVSGITDADGAPMESSFSWTFETVPNPAPSPNAAAAQRPE